jgi:hypothetical protein
VSTEFILYTAIIHNGFDMVLSLVRETKRLRPIRDRDLDQASRPRQDPIGMSRETVSRPRRTSRPRDHIPDAY